MGRPAILAASRPLTIRLEEHTIATLENLRNRTRRSVSELVRIAVSDFIRKSEAREAEALA